MLPQDTGPSGDSRAAFRQGSRFGFRWSTQEPETEHVTFGFADRCTTTALPRKATRGSCTTPNSGLVVWHAKVAPIW